MIYLKQLLVDGSGKYQVIRVKASSRDVLVADDWQDSSEEEYLQQFRDRTAPVESEADKALGESVGDGESQAEGEVKEEVKAEGEAEADKEAETKVDAEA